MISQYPIFRATEKTFFFGNSIHYETCSYMNRSVKSKSSILHKC
jgi:hypothetical protein